MRLSDNEKPVVRKSGEGLFKGLGDFIELLISWERLCMNLAWTSSMDLYTI